MQDKINLSYEYHHLVQQAASPMGPALGLGTSGPQTIHVLEQARLFLYKVIIL